MKFPLFDKGRNNRKAGRIGKRSILSRLKSAFKRHPKQDYEDHSITLTHRLGVMFARSMIVLALGVSWFISAPWLFLVLLPSFSFYNQWIVNYGTNIYAVYQIWQVVPEVLLFALSFFWTGGIIEMILGMDPLAKVF